MGVALRFEDVGSALTEVENSAPTAEIQTLRAWLGQGERQAHMTVAPPVYTPITGAVIQMVMAQLATFMTAFLLILLVLIIVAILVQTGGVAGSAGTMAVTMAKTVEDSAKALRETFRRWRNAPGFNQCGNEVDQLVALAGQMYQIVSSPGGYTQPKLARLSSIADQMTKALTKLFTCLGIPTSGKGHAASLKLIGDLLKKYKGMIRLR